MENLSRNKKNGTVELLCSRNKDNHTDEDVWTTTIEVHSGCKPKMMNNKQTLL
jgi:hypothetical protein